MAYTTKKNCDFCGKYYEGRGKKFCSLKCHRQTRVGDKSPCWKGNKVGIDALHHWMRRLIKKPKLCCICKKIPPYDLANIRPDKNEETYTRDFKNWFWVCRNCHCKQDKRIERLKLYKEKNRESLILYNKSRRTARKFCLNCRNEIFKYKKKVINCSLKCREEYKKKVLPNHQ